MTYRLAARARERWPQISRVNTRFKGGFGYVEAVLPKGETLRLCLLREGEAEQAGGEGEAEGADLGHGCAFRVFEWWCGGVLVRRR